MAEGRVTYADVAPDPAAKAFLERFDKFWNALEVDVDSFEVADVPRGALLFADMRLAMLLNGWDDAPDFVRALRTKVRTEIDRQLAEVHAEIDRQLARD
jgi:hypothetical protein